MSVGEGRTDRAKVLMVGVILVLIFVVGFLGFREATSPTVNPGESYLRVYNVPKSWTGAGWSDNPPYFVGEKYYWWLRITVCADANVRDVVVSDQLGGEFVIEGISFVAIEKPGPYEYTFSYSAYQFGGGVSVTDGATVWTGYLNETGVVFDTFVVYWTDETLKAHVECDVGSMGEGDVEEIYLTISTDTSPDGLQECTSAGTHLLNSGAAVEGIVDSTGKQASAESDGIEIEVLQKIE